MEIKEINNKGIWENFIFQCDEKTFLQSWNWGEFQKRMGNKIWRLCVSEENELLLVALIVKIQAKRGTFLFVPHGPIASLKIRSQKSKVKDLLEILTNNLKILAKKEKVGFVRIAPIWERNEDNTRIFKNLGFRNAPIHMHPELTWELDITFTEEQLLAGMRKTTRYLIKKAQKDKEIEIIKSRELKDVEIFNELYQKTVSRHHFAPFSLEYLKNEFSVFNLDNQIVVFLGKYKEKVISSGIFVFWQDIAFYHHGASALEYPKIPASYLLQWEGIKEAKKRNCKIYNFWGIAPTDRKNHPWAGLTLFKKGFGGCKKEYVKTQDLPLSKNYYFTCLFERIRKAKRNL